MGRFSFLLLALFAAPFSWAMDSTEILPKGINSPALRMGLVSGVDSKYTSDGSVMSLNDINTVEFSADQLTKISPEVAQLTSVLDQFSRQRLGSQIHLGTMRVETEPTVRYLAPIYARGLSEKFTFAVALPVVFYENKLSLNQSASNVSAICSQFSSLDRAIPEIKQACEQLDIKVVDATRQELAKKGYKPIQDRKETVMGDVQFVGLWKFFEQGKTSSLLRTTISVPTGKKNDPDDLADLGAFGLTAVEPMLLFNYLPFRPLRMAAKASYKFVAPDSAVARVPGSEGDILPGPETKERLSRDIGDSITLGSALTLGLGSSFSVAGGYEFSKKFADRFSGARGARYDLLEKDSESQAHRVRGAVSYDTIALYQRTQSFPPMKFDFEVTNTIAGINTDRQIVNELSVTMFF